MGAGAQDAGDVPGLEAVEDGVVLGAGQLLGGPHHRAQIRVLGSAGHRIQLHLRQLDGDAQLDHRLHPAQAHVQVGVAQLGQDLQAAGVDRGELPAERPAEVDDLPGRQVQLQHPGRLVVDQLPGLGKDGRQLALQQIHHFSSLRLPIPSEVEGRPAGAACLRSRADPFSVSPPVTASSISVMGPWVNR